MIQFTLNLEYFKTSFWSVSEIPPVLLLDGDFKTAILELFDDEHQGVAQVVISKQSFFNVFRMLSRVISERYIKNSYFFTF